MKPIWILYLKEVYGIDPDDIGIEETNKKMNIREAERIAGKYDLDTDPFKPSVRMDFCKKHNVDFYND